MIRTAGRALLWFALWSLPALLAVAMGRGVMVVEGRGPVRPLSTDLAIWLGTWWLWAVLAPLVYRLAARLRPLLKRTGLFVTLQVAAAVAFVGAHQLLFVLILAGVGFFPDDVGFGRAFLAMLGQTGPIQVAVYVGIAAGATGLHSLRVSRDREIRASQLEAQLSRARLDALRMQLHPHFLFNALNTVAMRVRRGADAEALELLVGFGELLRLILQGKRALIPLEEELDFARRYLEIEGARFGDRLRHGIRTEGAVATAAVPTLLLQPLLENALRHGVARSEEPVHVEIVARRRGDRVRIVVRNGGPGMPGDAPAEGTGGIGLRNTSERIREAFGDDADFSLERRDGEVRAVLDLPYRPVGEEAAAEPSTVEPDPDPVAHVSGVEARE